MNPKENVNPQQFQQMYLGTFPEPTEEEIYLEELSKEYHDRTEAYDRTVCTGPIIHGMIMPLTDWEFILINRNAILVRHEIIKRAKGKGIEEYKVRKALRDRYTFRGLKGLENDRRTV